MRTTRTRTRLAAVALALLLCGCDTAQIIKPVSSTVGRVPVWADEFDGPSGMIPNPTRWGFDVGTDWGNAQLEYDTDRAVNASLDGTGNLVLTARRESYNGKAYTSARITTRGLFSTTHGRIEARMRMPVGKGLWPAFWLLGDDIGTVGWPGCGEIDVMEYRGQEPNIVHGSLHGPGYSGGSAITKSFTRTGAGFDRDFHVFAIEWEPQRITYLVDDQPYQVVTPASLPSGARWVFEHPFHVILNLAVGGNYVGSPDGSTTFPQTLVVDYVRVYRLGD